MNQKQLMSLSKKDLIEKCTAKQLDTKGTKFDLVKRLMTTTEQSILHTIMHNTPVIVVKQDLQGHFVHHETLLVFDNNSQHVIGRKEHVDGDKIYPLTYTDIQNCLRYKFKYKLPENLAENLENRPSQKNKSLLNDEYLHKRLLEIKNPSLETSYDDDNEESEEEIDY